MIGKEGGRDGDRWRQGGRINNRVQQEVNKS